MLGKQAEEKESVLAEMERSTAAAVERTKKELEERSEGPCGCSSGKERGAQAAGGGRG